MLLTNQDSGRTVEISLGDTLIVRLDENPTTGYRWAVDAAGELEKAGDHFEAGSAIGAAGVRVFHFSPRNAGSHILRIKSWREWEGNASVINRFDANIIVR